MMIPSRAEGSPSDPNHPQIKAAILQSSLAKLPLEAIFASEPLENTLQAENKSAQETMKRFAMQYPEAFNAWQMGGLLENSQNHNIIEHQVMGAIHAGHLARLLGLTEQTAQDLELAYLIHDTDKLLENQTLDNITVAKHYENPEQRLAAVYDGLALVKKRTKRELKNNTYIPEHVIDLTDAVVPSSKDVWPTIEQQIIHWIDLAMDGTQITDPQKRIHANSGRRKPGRTALVYEAHSQHLEVPSYAELQISLAEKEARNFINRLHGIHPYLKTTLTDTSQLPILLRHMFHAKVDAFEKVS